MTVWFIFPFCSLLQQRALKARWSAALLKAMGLELRAELLDVPPGAMLVANHISWVDVFLINAVAPSAFVAKNEVRSWPLIGWLAARNETIFMCRGSAVHAQDINAEVKVLLQSGAHVAVFPEGTTSGGCNVKPFHAALLQPAVVIEAPLIPVAISYWEPDGQRSLAPRYDGDISFGKSLLEILGRRRLVAKVVAMPAIDVANQGRKLAATAARQMILTELG